MPLITRSTFVGDPLTALGTALVLTLRAIHAEWMSCPNYTGPLGLPTRNGMSYELWVSSLADQLCVGEGGDGFIHPEVHTWKNSFGAHWTL